MEVSVENFEGLLIGLITFVVIGAFHPLVVKAEYYIGTKSWILFCLLGILSCIASVFCPQRTFSIVLGVVAFSCFWSIREVFEQQHRVQKGWFPKKEKKEK